MKNAIDESPMSTRQIWLVCVAVMLSALDGYDLLAMSFAAPAVAEEFGLTSSSLGLLLSMELVGMGIGSSAMGMLADRFGRRFVILTSLIIMTVSMLLTPFSDTVVDIGFWRFFTGFGIGGVLATCAALVSEYSNQSRKNFNVAMMAVGFPVGGILGGALASVLLERYGWQSLFYFGGIISLLCIPLAAVFILESIHWLSLKCDPDSLARIDKLLLKTGKPALTASELAGGDDSGKTIADTEQITHFSRRVLATSTIYFMQVMTYYFLLKWIPKIMVDEGVSQSTASLLLMSVNIGGALGGIAFAFLSRLAELRKLLLLTFSLSFVGVALFGLSVDHMLTLFIVCTVAGFFGNAGVIGLYPYMAGVFPSSHRATGTGLCLGIGRLGAILSPILAGLLLAAQVEIATVSVLMAMGSFLAVAVLVFTDRKSDDSPAQDGRRENYG